MEKTHIQQTKESLAKLKLLAEYKRFKPGVDFICRAKHIGLHSFVQCLEKDSRSCEFSIRYSNSYFCKSPARVFAAKELNK
ncbi:MAG: hypothetical protein JSV60_06650 [Desulfobacterales bacterium]|nr:MAG: hypothetical protein JSV60_06650 [Desulfobacterales bacterium]